MKSTKTLYILSLLLVTTFLITFTLALSVNIPKPSGTSIINNSYTNINNTFNNYTDTIWFIDTDGRVKLRNATDVMIDKTTNPETCLGTPYDSNCEYNFYDESSCNAFNNHYGQCGSWFQDQLCNANYYPDPQCFGSDTYESTCLSYGNDPSCNSDYLCQYDGSTQCDSIAYLYGCQYWSGDGTSCINSGCSSDVCSYYYNDPTTCNNVGGGGLCSSYDYSYCPTNTGLTCEAQADGSACPAVNGCSWQNTYTYHSMETGFFNSTVPNGVCPYQSDSNTLCPNLNAGYLNGYDYSYFLDYNNLNNRPTVPTATGTTAQFAYFNATNSLTSDNKISYDSSGIYIDTSTLTATSNHIIKMQDSTRSGNAAWQSSFGATGTVSNSFNIVSNTNDSNNNPSVMIISGRSTGTTNVGFNGGGLGLNQQFGTSNQVFRGINIDTYVTQIGFPNYAGGLRFRVANNQQYSLIGSATSGMFFDVNGSSGTVSLLSTINSIAGILFKQSDGTIISTFDTLNKRFRIGDANSPRTKLDVIGDSEITTNLTVGNSVKTVDFLVGNGTYVTPNAKGINVSSDWNLGKTFSVSWWQYGFSTVGTGKYYIGESQNRLATFGDGVLYYSSAGHASGGVSMGIPQGQWGFVTVVRNGTSEVDLYVNGIFRGNIGSGFNDDWNPQRYLLCNGNTNTNVMDIPIDEFTIWNNTALSQAQINNLYSDGMGNYTLNSFNPAPLDIYHFDEGSGTVVTDSGQGGRTGTWASAPNYTKSYVALNYVNLDNKYCYANGMNSLGVSCESATLIHNETINYLNVTGNLTVYGQTSEFGNVNVTGNFSAKRPYLVATSNQTQSFLNTSLAQVMNFSIVEDNYLINIQNKQNITFLQTGDYMFTVMQEFYQNSGNNKQVMFWMQEWNGTSWNDVPRSNSRIDLNNGAYIPLSITLQADCLTSTKIRFMWWSDSTSTQMIDIPAQTNPSRPEIPAIILNVVKASEIAGSDIPVYTP